MTARSQHAQYMQDVIKKQFTFMPFEKLILVICVAELNFHELEKHF
jgi:hypothetical protein